MGTRSGWISALTLPRSSDVLVAFRDLHVSGLLYEHLSISLSRLAVGAALGVSVGIGAYVLEAGSLYDLNRLFAGVVVLSVLGVLVSAAISLLERHLLRWRT